MQLASKSDKIYFYNNIGGAKGTSGKIVPSGVQNFRWKNGKIMCFWELAPLPQENPGSDIE